MAVSNWPASKAFWRHFLRCFSILELSGSSSEEDAVDMLKRLGANGGVAAKEIVKESRVAEALLSSIVDRLLQCECRLL